MAGEQFGMQAVNLAGAESDTSAMQIEGLAKAGGQGLGQAVDGYNQANFNQAIQDGEAYLNQMADELDIPQEKRNMIKFFSGNPESVKAGAKFLMDSTEQQRRDTGINNMLGLGQGINEKYKALSAGILNKEGMTPEQFKSEQDKLISDKSGEIESLRVGSKDKYDLAGYDKVFGLGGSNASDDAWKRKAKERELDQGDSKIGLQQQRADLAEKKTDIGVEKEDSKRKIGALKAVQFGGPTGVRSMSRVSQELVKTVDEALANTKDGKTPGFMPFGSLQLAPQWVQSLVSGMSKSEKAAYGKEHKRKASALRNGIGRYLDRYKKFISGTAVSDKEYNNLINNLGAGSTNSFGEFLDAIISMTAQAQKTYEDNWNDVDEMYKLSDGSNPLSSSNIKNPADFMGKQLASLKSMREVVDGNQKFDGKLFYNDQTAKGYDLSSITDEFKAKAREAIQKQFNAADKANESETIVVDKDSDLEGIL